MGLLQDVYHKTCRAKQDFAEFVGPCGAISVQVLQMVMDEGCCLMRFLVVRPDSRLGSKLSLHEADDLLDNPFESWALASGKQILFVTNSLHKLIKQFYMYGTFESGAVYAVDYDEMVQILVDKLGPTDAIRSTARLVNKSSSESPGAHSELVAVNVFGTMVSALFKILWLCIKGIAMMIIIPLVLMFVGKR